MTTINVSPAPGRRVRDPETMQVITPGYAVDPTDPYWYRRLVAGDVTEDAAPEPAAGSADADTAALAAVETDLARAETDLTTAKSRRAPSDAS